MKKLKMYLETSVLNFIFAEDSPEKMEATKRLFEEIKQGKFEPYVSAVVIQEIENASEKKRLQLVSIFDKYKIAVISAEDEMEELADVYVSEGLVPPKYRNDALHIAVATVADMDIMVSWNFKHIVKMKTITLVGYLNEREGYRNIRIFSPEEVIEHED